MVRLSDRDRRQGGLLDLQVLHADPCEGHRPDVREQLPVRLPLGDTQRRAGDQGTDGMGRAADRWTQGHSPVLQTKITGTWSDLR